MRRRAVLSVRGDSIAALVAVLKLRAAKGNGRFLARELALEFSEAAYEPRVVAHLPGVANVVADTLSRRFDPNKKWEVPSMLKHLPETRVPDRTDDYYLTLSSHRAQSK